MAQTLTTTIVINARAGNGFSEIGNTLMELGTLVNGVSQEIINFGKESVNVYREYDKSMADTEVALATKYGQGTRKLQEVMTDLDEAAAGWASTTIFHTDDIANGINLLAHAGWDYEKIMAGMPGAINLARAGSLDLSEAIDYVVSSSYALGIESTEDISHFMDLWVYAANSSKNTVEDIGEAMARMGSTMRFAANPEELMTLIAVTGNAGTTGSAAGTLIRNSLMRLIAPTKKAKEAMAELGATTIETSEIMADEDLMAANARLAETGFSVYDEKGNMKSVLDIYRELYLALGEMAGGFDYLDENNEVIGEVVGAIFPTRTIQEALTLLRGAAEGYDGLYDSMMNGDAEGYAQYASDRMNETLDAQIELYNSKVEELKRETGQELAPQIESVLGSLGDIVDKVNGMDSTAFSILVKDAEVLAAAGPGLLLAGGAFKAIGLVAGMMSGPWAAGAVAATAFATAGLLAINAAHEIEEADFESKFGDMSLNQEQVGSFLQTLASDFETANAPIKEYGDALDSAVESYKTASTELKASLLTDLLTDTELDDTQINTLKGLGEKMIQSVANGIEANYSGVAQGIVNAFGGEGTEGEDIDNPIWDQISDILTQGYQADIERANELSQQLREAMTSAFKDGSLTSDEIANIQQIIDEQNKLLAQQQEIENYARRQAILRKGQTLGLEGIQEAVGMAKGQMDEEWEQKLQQQDRDYAALSTYYDNAIENGWEVANTDGTEGTHAATRTDKAVALHELKGQQEAERYRWTASESGFIMQTMLEGIKSSDLAETWEAAEQLADDFREAGGIVTQAASNTYNDAVTSPHDATQMSRYLNMMVDELGGYERIQGFVDYFMSQGDTTSALQYQQILDMYDAIGWGAKTNPEVGTQGKGDYSDIAGTYQQMATLLSGAGTALTPEGLAEHLRESAELGISPDWAGTLGQDLYSQFISAVSTAGIDLPIEDAITQWVQQAEQESLELNVEPVISETDTDLEDQTMNVVPQVDESAIQNLDPQPLPIRPYIEGEDAAEQLLDQDVNVSVGGETEQLQAVIDAEDGKNLLEYIDGDATDLSMAIYEQDGKTLIEQVTGNVSALEAAIEKCNGRTITVNIAARQLFYGFAEGGRATTASIFGEAGPEWAIPEEHSERTAELLNAAREASGFTWPDLLARYGGLNANTDREPTTIIYSPTINAADASGVEQVLLADKERLNRWFEEKKMRDEVEVYA